MNYEQFLARLRATEKDPNKKRLCEMLRPALDVCMDLSNLKENEVGMQHLRTLRKAAKDTLERIGVSDD